MTAEVLQQQDEDVTGEELVLEERACIGAKTGFVPYSFSELSIDLLHWAYAKSIGMNVTNKIDTYIEPGLPGTWKFRHFSSDPIAQEELDTLATIKTSEDPSASANVRWKAVIDGASPSDATSAFGRTEGLAKVRAFVKSKCGDCIQVPLAVWESSLVKTFQDRQSAEEEEFNESHGFNHNLSDRQRYREGY